MQADYFAFIASAYGISAIAVAALFAWVFVDARAQRRALTMLEAQGFRRRSEASRQDQARGAGQ